MIAGSGKTTVGRAILEHCGFSEQRTLCMGYTGQAVRRMRQNGLEAYTIHRSLMRPVKKPLIINGTMQDREGIPYMAMKWEFITSLPDWVEAIFIDEYSFVNAEFEDKIKALAFKKGIPVFCVGDPEQLDPIMGAGRFSRNDLHFFLNKPRRQALESDIYRLAMEIREGKTIDPDDYMFLDRNGRLRGKGQVMFLRQQDSKKKMIKYYEELLKYTEAILVTANEQRNEITDMIRHDIYGIDSLTPVAGEKLLCRQNNFNLVVDTDYPLINGTVGYCMRDIPFSDIDYKRQLYTMDFRPIDIQNDYFDSLVCDLEFLNTPFKSNKPKNMYNPGNKLEYAYAGTVHSSQGMQYRDICYMERFIPNVETMRKIRYTAITRAIGSVAWFI